MVSDFISDGRFYYVAIAGNVRNFILARTHSQSFNNMSTHHESLREPAMKKDIFV